MFRDVRAPLAVYSRNMHARASAVLAGAGAYDTTPIALPCAGFVYMLLLVSYTRAGAGGSVGLKIEALLPDLSSSIWYQFTTYKQGTVVAGSDTASLVQRESIVYQATGAGAELFTYGPLLLGGNIEQVRINAHEVGAVGTPGTVRIEARFA